MMADEVTLALESRGAEVLGPAGTVAEAQAAIHDAGHIDATVLDLNLRGEATWPVLERLLAAGVPVVLTTGYGEDVIPARFAHVKRCLKPVTMRELSAALSDEIAARSP